MGLIARAWRALLAIGLLAIGLMTTVSFTRLAPHQNNVSEVASMDSLIDEKLSVTGRDGTSVTGRDGTVSLQRANCYSLALLAGCSGLMAQVVWARLFVQVFGATTQAVAIVLATFLGGLALGAFLLGRLADRSDNPLRLAGLFVTLSGAAMAIGIGILAPAAAMLESLFGDASFSSAPRTFSRIVFASLLVLPPTAMFGGVAPALMCAIGTGRRSWRPRFSAIFGFETLGGAIGALAAGFYLIAAFGLHGTLWLAAGISMVAGAFFVVTSRKRLPASPEVEEAEPVVALPPGTPRDGWLLLGIGVAGFATLGMEVVWTRLLLLVLGGDTYAYTIVVTSFLLGLALGAGIAHRITPRLLQPLGAYGWLQLATAGCSVASLVVFSWLAGGAGQKWLESFEGDWGTVLAGRFALSAGVLLIPATLVGLGFPVAASHFLRQEEHLGSRVGRLYAASALGNVAGALAIGFLLIATIGLQFSVVALAAMNLAAAACVVFPGRGPWHSAFHPFGRERGTRRLQTALIGVGLLACVGWPWLQPIQPLGLDANRQDFDVIYYREGLAGTVAVLQSRGESGERVMSVDGIIIGESRGGVDEKQRMLAHLPYLLRPAGANRRLLTIGLGTGILAGELVQLPGSEEVVCVELSQAVIEGARHFAELNGNIHAHSRAKIVAGDGIHYLRQDRSTFDAIVSDAKSRPGHAGNVAFYSADYYALCRQRLATDGLMVQWVSLETPPRELRVILHTFIRSFPQSYIGIAPPDSLYLIGAKEPLRFDIDEMQRHLDSPQASRLRDYGWRDACDFLGLLLADGAAVERWLTADTPINTLDRPVIEFQAVDTFGTPPATRKRENLAALTRLTERPPEAFPMKGADEQLLKNCQRSGQRMLQAVGLMMGDEVEGLRQAAEKFDEGRRLAPRHTRLRLIAADMHLRQAESAEMANDLLSAIRHYQSALDYHSEGIYAHQRLATLLTQAGALREAAQQYYLALQIEPRNVSLRLAFGYHLAIMEKPAQAAAQFRMALQEHPDEPRAHLGLGLTLLALNEPSQSRYHFARAVKLDASLLPELSALGIDVPHDH